MRAQPRDQHARPADTDARHRAPPLAAAAVHQRDELAERVDPLAGQTRRDQRLEPATHRVLGGRRRDRPLPRDLLDQLQGDGREARLAVFRDRRLQVRHQHRRTVAQRRRDQVIAHRAQQPLNVDLGGRVRIEVQPRDRRDRQAFHARAQRREFGAAVGAQLSLFQLLGTVGHEGQ